MFVVRTKIIKQKQYQQQLSMADNGEVDDKVLH